MPVPVDNHQLLASIRAWAAVNYPACPLEYVSIHLRYLPVPIRLAASHPSPQIAQESRGDQEKVKGLSPVILDILKVMREIKSPLSRTRLLEEMAKRGMDWNERTVAGYLARLVEDGTLENPEDSRPRGYRLPEND